MIRPTVHSDIPRLVTMEAGGDTVEWLGETGVSWHQRALADPYQEHLTAEIRGEIVGFAVLAGLDGAYVEVRRIVLSPKWRGDGMGRSMLRGVVARAYGQHAASRVWLDVKSGNDRARTLYESEGFQVSEVLVSALTEADGSLADLIVMTHQKP